METIGNAFKTIFSRMQNIKVGNLIDPETNEDLNDVETTLGGMGIKLRENNNTWRNFGDVLDEVAVKWNTFSETQKSALSTAFAGTRQKEIFLTLMENYDSATQYAQSASDAFGTANEKYEIYMDSVQAKQNQLTASFQEFYSNILNSGLISGLTDFANLLMQIMNLGNGTVGKILLLVTAFTALNFVLKSNALASFRSILLDVGKSIKTVITAIPAMIAGLRGQKTAQDALNTSTATGNALAMTNPWLAIAEIAVMAIMGITMAMDAHNQAIQESIDKAKELTEAYKSAKQEFTDNINSLTETTSLNSSGEEYESLSEEFEDLCKGVDAYGNKLSLTSDQYERYKSICEQIVGLNPDLLDGYDSEVEAIGKKNEKLQETIDLLKEQQRQKSEELFKKSEDTLVGYANDYDKNTSEAKGIMDNAEFRSKISFTNSNINNIIGTFSQDVIDKYFFSNGVNPFSDILSKNIEDLVDNWKNVYKPQLEGIKQEFLDYANQVNSDSDPNNDINKTGIEQFELAYDEYIKMIESAVKDYGDNTEIVNSASEEFNNLISDLYDATLEKNEGYYNLDTGTKSFLSNWIKNSDMFEIDPSTSDEAQNKALKANQELIQKIYNSIVDENGKITEGGKKVQLSLSDLYEFDTDLSYDEYQKQIYDVINKISDITGMSDKEIRIALGVDVQWDDDEISGENLEGVDELAETLSNKFGESISDVEDKLGKMSTKSVQALLEMDETVLQNCESWNRLKVAIANALSDTPPMAEVFSGYADNLQSLSEQYEILSKAQEEYNEYGNITASTMKKIIDNGLLDYLTVENGQLQFNTQALQDNATALQNDAIAKLQDSLFTDLQSIALGTYQSTLDSTDSGNANAQLVAFQTELGNTTDKALQTAGAISALNSAMGTDYKFNDEKKEQAYAVVQHYNDMVTKVKSLSTNLSSGSYRSGSGKSGGSGSSKSEKEWWEKQLDSFKDKLDYNEISMDTYINSLTNLLSKLKKGTEAWNKVNKELQKARFDNIKNQFDRGEITIDTYIDKLAQLRKAYKKNTEEYKKLTQTINETKADKWADQYERGEISLNSYVKNLTNLRNTYKKNSEAWKEYNDLINETKYKYYQDSYERDDISADKYVKYLKELQKQYKKGSDMYYELAEEINNALLDKTEKWLETLSDGIDEIERKMNRLGDVNTTSEQIEYARLLSKEYRNVRDNIKKIQSELRKTNLTEEQRNALQEQLDDLLEKEIDIRDEIEDSARDYYENQKEQLEQQAELTKKQTLYDKEVELYGKQGKELYEYYTNKEIEALEAKQKALDEVNEREELENNLLEAKLKLQNALNNKTTKILTKQDDGTWAYTFSANMANVKEAQKELADAEKAIEDYELQEQIDKLNESMDKLAGIYEDAEFWAEREYEQTMNSIEKAYGDIDGLVEKWMESYGYNSGKLIKTYQKLTASNADLKQALANLEIAINTKYETIGNNGTITPKSFDTGGEIRGTGLIFAHDKERVLTQEQNINFIKLLDNIDNFNKLIDVSKVSIPNLNRSNSNIGSKSEEQVIINGVTCNFPNITTTDGLQKAILDLPRLAIQQSAIRHNK